MWDHTVLPVTRQSWHSRLYPSRSWHSIKRPRRDARLSWPIWLVMYRDGIPTRRWSPIQVLTGVDVRQLRSCDGLCYPLCHAANCCVCCDRNASCVAIPVLLSVARTDAVPRTSTTAAPWSRRRLAMSQDVWSWSSGNTTEPSAICTLCDCLRRNRYVVLDVNCLQCFDTFGCAAGRASGL